MPQPEAVIGVIREQQRRDVHDVAGPVVEADGHLRRIPAYNALRAAQRRELPAFEVELYKARAGVREAVVEGVGENLVAAALVDARILPVLQEGQAGGAVAERELI